MISQMLYPARTERYQRPVDCEILPVDTNWFGPTAEKPIYLYTYEKSYVTPYGVVGKWNGHFNESVYPMVRGSFPKLTFLKKLVLGRVKKNDSNCLVFHHVWYDNYYHWITECLPRLFLMRHQLHEFTIVLPPRLNRFHTQTLQLFDLKNVVTCDESNVLLCNSVSVPSFISEQFGIHHKEVSVELINFLKRKAGDLPRTATRRILTLRRNAPKRKCINQKELAELAIRYGFELIDPSDLDFVDQVKLFAEAKVVMGIHGSGFVNAACMQRNGVVIDFMESKHNDYCFANFLSLFNIEYRIIWSKGVGRSDNFRNNDLVVDLTALEKLLREVL